MTQILEIVLFEELNFDDRFSVSSSCQTAIFAGLEKELKNTCFFCYWYIFFADKVEIQDITNQTSMFALLGPDGSKIMKDWVLEILLDNHMARTNIPVPLIASVGAMPLSVAVGSIISTEGFTFMMSPAAAKSVWKALLGQGATPMSSGAWEILRVLRGRPAPGKELTDEFNVFEAGLWQAVSLSKGVIKDKRRSQDLSLMMESNRDCGGSVYHLPWNQVTYYN
ncbi:hypothetical protein OROGR_031308 [Orobanche gracilis]